MIDQCDTEVSVCGMFEVVMAAGHVMNKKIGSFKTTENLDAEFGNSLPHWPAFPDTADALR